MGVIELTKEVRTQVNAATNGSARNLQSVESPLHVTRVDKKAENTLYQGVVFIARGSTISLPAVERFRMLRAKIERMNLGEQQHRVFAVTSAVPQEGKSVISVNLARALSVDPLGKTLLIDCDLRRPTVHEFFDQPREPGLSDVLNGKYTFRSVIRSAGAGLDIVTAGSMIPDPTLAIEQPHLARYLDELRKDYRYIVIDCPPVLVCPEPISLSSIADSTLLVVRAWRTNRALVEDAVSIIGKSRILGVVMNDGVDPSKEYLDYGYYSYQPEAETKAAKKQLKKTAPAERAR